jgi:hypothetical protein
MTATKADLSPRAIDTLHKYIEYFNMWADNEKARGFGGGEHISFDEFFKYGETRLLGVVKLGHGEEIIILEAGYGDEGGPALLVAKFENWNLLHNPIGGRPRQDAWELRWMMQEFDTTPSMIWAEGKFVNNPEDFKEVTGG